MIVAAYAEEEVIAARVANLRALDYPAERLEVIVACDGSPDATAERARAAGADVVLELPRGGKIRAQDAGVERAPGEIVAFSDANASGSRGALRRAGRAVRRSARRLRVRRRPLRQRARAPTRRGSTGATRWRCARSSRALRSVTGGNGAIYATRRESYLVVDPIMGHDLSFPFNMVKRGWLAVYVPDARASEKMVPTIEGEFARKRRMMSHGWPIVVRGGMLSPRGYDPLYALMIFSHRILRYLSPFLHLIVLGDEHRAARRRLGVRRRASRSRSRVLLAALLAPLLPARPLLVARYYVLTTASLAAGLWDWLRARDAGGLGAGGGHAMIKRAARHRRRARSARC